MNPRVMIFIDTYAIGGAGKVIFQFLRSGGTDICVPIVAGFWRGPDGAWQFREAVEKLNVRFEVLRQTFAFDPLVIRMALKLVRKENIQILESHGYKGHVVCLALKKLTGLPWIAYVHGWTRENMKVALYYRVERVVIRFADRIVPVSDGLGKQLKLGNGVRQKMVVVHNAADPEAAGGESEDVRAGLGVKRDEVLLGVVGRLSPEKGHRHLLAAVRLMPPEIAIKVVFVGDGQERNSLADEIQNTGLGSRVMLAGFQSDVSPFYRACDIIVLPSLAEGMPNAALEAMAFARPVVATDVGGIPEVVIDGQTGLLVPSANPKAMASALTQLACDKPRMKKFGMAGRERLERHFNPKERVGKIAEIYAQVLRA